MVLRKPFLGESGLTPASIREAALPLARRTSRSRRGTEDAEGAPASRRARLRSPVREGTSIRRTLDRTRAAPPQAEFGPSCDRRRFAVGAPRPSRASPSCAFRRAPRACMGAPPAPGRSTFGTAEQREPPRGVVPGGRLVLRRSKARRGGRMSEGRERSLLTSGDAGANAQPSSLPEVCADRSPALLASTCGHRTRSLPRSRNDRISRTR